MGNLGKSRINTKIAGNEADTVNETTIQILQDKC